MAEITLKEKLLCAERELAFRHRVYDRMVVRGKMSKTEQAYELLVMQSIVDDYRAAVAADEPEFALFIETRRDMERGQRGQPKGKYPPWPE